MGVEICKAYGGLRFSDIKGIGRIFVLFRFLASDHGRFWSHRVCGYRLNHLLYTDKKDRICLLDCVPIDRVLFECYQFDADYTFHAVNSRNVSMQVSSF